MPNDDAEALTALIGSEGWRLLVSAAESQWSDSTVLSRIKAAISGLPSGDELSQQESARNMLAAQSAVLQMLAWPEQEIQRLKSHQPVGEQSKVDWFKRMVGR